MKLKLALPLIFLCAAAAQAQNVENQVIASQYGQFQLQGTAQNTYVFSPNACQVTAGNKNFTALQQGVPVRIVDPGNHALDETVTAGLVNPSVCSVQLAAANNHLPPFYLTSGTAGLQEAINANGSGNTTNTIILDAKWYALGGTTGIIGSVTGATNLGLVDVTQTPYVWYQWDGSHYVAVSVGSNGFPITLGSTPVTASSTTTAVSGITVDGVSPTTMGYVDATSSIQTQLNEKASAAGSQGNPQANSGTGFAAIKKYEVDAFPSSCTVGGTAYTTQTDCAFYTAAAYAVANSLQTETDFSCARYTTNGLDEPTGLYSVSLKGCGIFGTYLTYTGSAARPVISRAHGSNYTFLQLADMSIDGGGDASSDADLFTLNQSVISNLALYNIAPSQDHFIEIGDTPGDAYQIHASNIDIVPPGVFGPANYATVTANVVGGAITSYTVVNGGTGYNGSTNLVAIFNGYQSGYTSYKPCATLPTQPTISVSGGAIASVTPSGTNGSGCSGTIDIIIAPVFPVNYGLVWHASDSTMDDVITYAGATAGILINAGNGVYSHLHPALIPVGIENESNSTFHGTELDSVLQFGFDFEGTLYTGTSVYGTNTYVGTRFLPGTAPYYFGPGAGYVKFGSQGDLCSGTKPLDWHEFITQSGPVDEGAAYPPGVSVNGNDTVCATTGDVIANPSTGPAQVLAPTGNPQAYEQFGRGSGGSIAAAFGWDGGHDVATLQSAGGISFNIAGNPFGTGQVAGFSPSGYPQLTLGSSVAAADTIYPGNFGVYHVTGTATINTISVYTGCTTAGLTCTEELISDNGFSTGTSGNIAVALQTTPGQAYFFTYDPATALWYPTPSSGIPSLNGQIGAQSIVAGANTVVTPNGSNQVAVSVPSLVPSVNGSSGAQTFAASGGGLTLVDAGATHTYTLVGGGLTGGVTSETIYLDGGYAATGTTIGSQGNSSTVPTMLTAAQMQAAVNAMDGGLLHINGQEFPFTNTSNYPVQDNRPGTTEWSVTNSGAACNAVLAFATVTSGSNVINLNTGYSFVASDAGDSGTNLGAKWISMVGLVSGVPTRFDAYITAVNSGTQAVLSANSPFSASDYSVTVGNDDTSQLAQAVSYAHNGDARLSFPGNANSGGVCWSRTAALALNGTPMSGLPNGGILGGAGLDTTQGASGYIRDMQFYVDARIDATHPWSWDNNGTTTAQTALYRPVGVMTPAANNPMGPGWIRGSEPYGLYAYNGVAATTSGSANMCVLTAAGSVPPVGSDIVFPYLTTVLHATVITPAGTCGAGTPITLSATVPATVAQAEYFWGEAPGASASGTAVQEINTAIPATGRSFPMTVNLKNPINPEPGAESDFAPFGLVKIDGEEFQYYKTSSYPAVSGQWLKLTSGAQNGTSAAAHSVGAAIVPLNPFMPALPWPVTTINGGANQTPAGAEYYPAFNIGNSAISQPVPDGTGFSGGGAFSESHVVGNTIRAWPNTVANSAEDPYSFQSTNSTAGMYMVPLPFNSWFLRNNIAGTQFGIWEGVAAQNNHDYIGVPTSDTVVFDSNHVSVGYSVGLIGGGTLAFTNNQLFSQNGPPNSGWYPYTPAASSGSAVCAYFSAYGPDDTVGLSRGQYSWGSEVFDAQFSATDYCEAETGALNGTQPIGVYDFNSTVWPGLSDMGGGTNYLGGTGNHISGGPFTQGDTEPLIIDGSNETVDFASNSLANTGINNTWMASPVLVWGPNDTVTGGGPSGDGRLSYGNGTATVAGQTNEFAATGNLTAPYVNSQGGFFAADTLNPVSQAGTGVGWQFDGTAANMTQGYSACVVGTGVNTVQCTLFFNNRTQQAPEIGPGQAMVAGKYIWTMGVRSTSGSAQTFGAYAATSCGYLDTSHTSIPISTTWTNVEVGVIDFSSASGCALQMALNGTSTSATAIEIAYISFVPLPQNLMVNNLNVLGSCSGPGCTTGTPTTVQVNGTPVTTQSPINIQSGTNTTVSNPSAGNIRIDATGGSSAVFPGTPGVVYSTSTTASRNAASADVVGLFTGSPGSTLYMRSDGTLATAVSSVGLSMPASILTVSGSPVTTSGTLTAALATQAANTVWANATSSAAAPTFTANPVVNSITLTGTTPTCPSGTACILAGAGVPTGSCQNSSIYLNTTGSTGTRQYQCQGTSWADIN